MGGNPMSRKRKLLSEGVGSSFEGVGSNFDSPEHKRKQTKGRRRTRKRRLPKGEHKDMVSVLRDHQNAFLELLETAADGTDHSMGKPSIEKFWHNFTERLIINTKDIRLDFESCVCYAKYFKDLNYQFKNPDKQRPSVRALNDSSLYNTEFKQRLSRIFGRRTVAIPRPKTQRTSSLRLSGSNGTGQTNLIGQPSFGSGSTVAPGLDTKIDGILGQLVFDKKLSYKDVNELQACITRGNTSSRIFLQGTEDQSDSRMAERSES